jgi:hypothetical protein
MPMIIELQVHDQLRSRCCAGRYWLSRTPRTGKHPVTVPHIAVITGTLVTERRLKHIDQTDRPITNLRRILLRC